MNIFSRRSFLKGILATAVAVNIPVELIEQATKAIDIIPNEAITRRNPLCYLKINELLVPTGFIEFSQPLGSISKVYVPRGFNRFEPIAYSRAEPDFCSLFFTTDRNYFRSSNDKEVIFTIVSNHLPFELKGKGYFSEMIYYNDGPSKEGEFNYSYSISGELLEG